MTERRLAILVELPRGDRDLVAFRRLLKCLLRSFGLKCLAVKEPSETKTFETDGTTKCQSPKPPRVTR